MGRGMGGKSKSLLSWPAVETLFMQFGRGGRSAGAGQVDIYVGTLSVISNAVNKEEWGYACGVGRSDLERRALESSGRRGSLSSSPPRVEEAATLGIEG